MSKIHINLSIDEGLIKEAKSKFINISETAEKAIKEKLKIKEVEIKEALKCEFCDKEGTKETIKEAKDEIGRKNALTWLYPDERWICNMCLKIKYKKLVIVQ